MRIPDSTGTLASEFRRRKRRNLICPPLLALLVLSPLLAQPQPQPPPSGVYQNPQALAAELRRLQQAVHEGHGDHVTAAMPSSWTVRGVSGHSYTILSEQLRNSIDTPDMAEEWLSGMAHQLEGYATGRAAAPDARAQLSRILARPEFSNVKPPSPVELYWQSFRNWLLQQLARLFSLAGGNTIRGKVLFALVAIAAIIVLESWLLNLWGARRRKLPATPQSSVPAWTWQKWAVAAREAADRGDTRTAIHCCYWAAVVRLQDLRRLPGDLTHTPREYLRLVPAHESSHTALAALTECLERIWYANRPADPGDLDRTFSYLETLGCRL